MAFYSQISSIQVTVNSSDPFPDLQIGKKILSGSLMMQSGIDESYSVTVSDKIYVEAPTVWGVLRGVLHFMTISSHNLRIRNCSSAVKLGWKYFYNSEYTTTY